MALSHIFPASYSINVVLLVGLVFDDIDGFLGHAAGVVMIFPRPLLAWALLLRFHAVAHHGTHSAE